MKIAIFGQKLTRTNCAARPPRRTQEIHTPTGQPRREFSDVELAGPDAVPDRTEERDNLLAMLHKKHLDSLIGEIQKMRKKMDLAPMEFIDEEDLTEELGQLIRCCRCMRKFARFGKSWR